MQNEDNFDKRYKYRLKEKSSFYIYRRNKKNNIYYVRYKNGRTVSTGKTSLKQAYIYAQVFFDTSLKQEKKSEIASKNAKITLNEIIVNYYKIDSEYIDYDKKHGTKYTEKTLKFNDGRMQNVAGILIDVIYPEDLTRNRLIQLQDDLLKQGLSGKTVNNYFSIFHKIYNQLLDKEIIKIDPFLNLRPCSFTKELRLCFPLEKIKGAFSTIENKYILLSFIACSTGMRRSEIQRIQKDDFIIKNGTEWLKVRGTKTIYSVREVPVYDELKKAILRFINNDYQERDFQKSVLELGNKIGCNKDYIQRNGIKFHSFRKLYKTLLTQSNLNTTLVESLMGHTTQNQMSNNVERIYFVRESADLSKIHKQVIDSLKYLI